MASSLVCPLEAPPYYAITLHLIGGISVPINILALYLVWYHSPNMGKYKYCLSYLQGVALIVELWMSWVCPGLYYFPMLGGYNISIMSKYITTHMSCVFFFFVFSFEMPALLFCFEYRFHAAKELESSTKSGKKLTYFVLSSSHTFPFVIAFCLMKSELTKEEQLESVKKYYPNCLPAASIHPSFLIYDYHTNPWTMTVGLSAIIYISIYFLYAVVQAARTNLILHRMKAHMSQQTYKIHRAALLSLALQTVVPIIFLVIPLTMVTFVVLYDLIEFQGMNTTLIVLSLMYLFSEIASDTNFVMSAHTMASSLVIMITTKRYRTIIIESVVKRIPYLHVLENVVSVERTTYIVRTIIPTSRSDGRTV